MWGLFYEELHYLRIIKSQAYIRGDIGAYRDTLEEIYTMLSFVRDDKSFNSHDLVREATNNTPEFDIENQFEQASEAYAQQRPECKSLFREIDKALIQCMFRNNFIFNKKKKTGLGDVEKRYGVQDQDDKK